MSIYCAIHPDEKISLRGVKLICLICESEAKHSIGDLLGTDVELPTDATKMPKPTCSKCGGEIPFFYFYVYRLQSTQGTMLFQASCCPHAGCRALFMVLPVGVETSPIAAPGKQNWPGMPA